MFQFPGFAFVPYVFRYKYLLVISASPNPPLGLQAPASELQISKVGFPIRRFPDQSSFAAPRNLSQRTTSFIASQRQGIHRIPLCHLIALIIDVHHRFPSAEEPVICRARPERRTGWRSMYYKDQLLLQTHPGALRSSYAHWLVMHTVTGCPDRYPNVFPLYDVR